MVSDSLLKSQVPWFDLEKKVRFPVAEHVDVAGLLPDPVLSGHTQYFEWYCR